MVLDHSRETLDLLCVVTAAQHLGDLGREDVCCQAGNLQHSSYDYLNFFNLDDELVMSSYSDVM